MAFKRQLLNTNFEINNTNFFYLKFIVANWYTLFWHSRFRKSFSANFTEKHLNKLKIIAAMYIDLIFLWFPPTFLISIFFMLWENIMKEKTINYYERQHWFFERKDNENRLFLMTIYVISLLMWMNLKMWISRYIYGLILLSCAVDKLSWRNFLS